jgi:hypothetical protein
VLLLLMIAVAGAGEILGPFQTGDTVKVPEKAWLVPDAHYNTCLARAMDAADLTVRLDRCTERGVQELTRCDAALSLCDKALASAASQFDADEQTVNDLALTVLDLERTLAAAESDKARLRDQRNVAWAVTGGVVLTLTSAAAIAIGVP